MVYNIHQHRRREHINKQQTERYLANLVHLEALLTTAQGYVSEALKQGNGGIPPYDLMLAVAEINKTMFKINEYITHYLGELPQ